MSVHGTQLRAPAVSRMGEASPCSFVVVVLLRTLAGAQMPHPVHHFVGREASRFWRRAEWMGCLALLRLAHAFPPLARTWRSPRCSVASRVSVPPVRVAKLVLGLAASVLVGAWRRLLPLLLT